LAPASATGQAAATLAQIMAVRSRDRKQFYRKIEEALAHGDDGEPGCLVIVDGFFFLTRFDQCQANRRTRDNGGAVTSN
jgi:hypothetical protein